MQSKRHYLPSKKRESVMTEKMEIYSVPNPKERINIGKVFLTNERRVLC